MLLDSYTLGPRELCLTTSQLPAEQVDIYLRFQRLVSLWRFMRADIKRLNQNQAHQEAMDENMVNELESVCRMMEFQWTFPNCFVFQHSDVFTVVWDNLLGKVPDLEGLGYPEQVDAMRKLGTRIFHRDGAFKILQHRILCTDEGRIMNGSRL